MRESSEDAVIAGSRLEVLRQSREASTSRSFSSDHPDGLSMLAPDPAGFPRIASKVCTVLRRRTVTKGPVSCNFHSQPGHAIRQSPESSSELPKPRRTGSGSQRTELKISSAGLPRQLPFKVSSPLPISSLKPLQSLRFPPRFSSLGSGAPPTGARLRE